MQTKPLQTKALITVLSIIFGAFALWWIHIQRLDIDATRSLRQIWGASYQILALFGSITGFIISYKWGGYKSRLGRTIFLFSLGLLLQVFGQSYSSYYVYHFDVESPLYPSIGDVGFFGSVLAYIYGVLQLAKTSGIHVSLKKIQNKVWMLVIPLGMLVFAYEFFLKGYDFGSVSAMQGFLDFAYPLGQALYVSIAIIALLMSWNILGGIMKRPLWVLIFALIFQYFADFFFLYQSVAGTWYVGNINDFLYAASYFLMSISLIQFGVALNKVRGE